MASPSILPIPLVKASQMGYKYPSTSTPHKNMKRRRESVATFPMGADREGEGNTDPTPTLTTLYRDASKAWMAALESTKVERTVDGGGNVD